MNQGMTRKRKRYLLAGLLLAVCFCAATMYAWADNGSAGRRIYDEAGLFTDAEADELQALAEEKIAEARLDIVVVTVEDTGGKSAMAYADDFYDDNGFGYDGNTGVLLLIDMGEREIWISTTGKAEAYFTDARLSALIETVTAALSDGDYAEGARQFIEDSANYMYNTPQTGEWSASRGWLSGAAENVLPCLGIAVAIAALVVIVMYLQQRNAGVADAHTYLKDERYSVDGRQDLFTHTTTVRRRIETNNGGGGHSSHGGGGGHISSSGTHHGGGGGHF